MEKVGEAWEIKSDTVVVWVGVLNGCVERHGPSSIGNIHQSKCALCNRFKCLLPHISLEFIPSHFSMVSCCCFRKGSICRALVLSHPRSHIGSRGFRGHAITRDSCVQSEPDAFHYSRWDAYSSIHYFLETLSYICMSAYLQTGWVVFKRLPFTFMAQQYN